MVRYANILEHMCPVGANKEKYTVGESLLCSALTVEKYDCEWKLKNFRR